ncbi:hypothetical protein [Mongoliitalea lutea]|uniref:Uncharacterized protein n=1 Tax=Mongoliitalea lutea TaxID=849756 RepID=A0A8J3G5E4_9BACT|nr:hypothetical protein [Mongoliitalea lutea]GHB38896.1 hypothetical protein GCM10008106_20130 [Mongoliitalea lutea]
MNRRDFIERSILGGSSILLFPSLLGACETKQASGLDQQIRQLSTSLLEKWCEGLLANQTHSPENPITHGGIYSPGDEAYQGRCADAIVPFLWMAKYSNDPKYIRAAKDVYAWEQHNCWSEELGCWFNNPNLPNSWKGITVFAAMTKVEAINHYADLLGEETVDDWKKQLKRAADYLYETLTISFGNINYPATGIWVFYHLGKLFEEEKYIHRAAELANDLMSYFTPEGLFFGEGGRERHPSGQFPVDLGYNVEESLPAMALYAKTVGNQELLDKAIHSMRVHLEFMLPNGTWDNSWGTRSFKWTYWGSRTSDGCHPGYYILADQEPVFAEAVYRNLQALEASTFDQLLYAGPHEYLAGVDPSVHHTFNHAKSLANLLYLSKPEIPSGQFLLPREKADGLKQFEDINTILFAKGPWRGTVSAYAVPYKTEINGQASGGALTVLYHTNQGFISAASMTEYQRWEKFNMLDEKKLSNFMNLTPRLELVQREGKVYRNISDLNANLVSKESPDLLHITAFSKLVNGQQEVPNEGSPTVKVEYLVTEKDFWIEISTDIAHLEGRLQYIFPVVCSSDDVVSLDSNSFKCHSKNGTLTVQSNIPLIASSEDYRVYNFSPGLQAFPLKFGCANIHQEKLKLSFSFMPLT